MSKTQPPIKDLFQDALNAQRAGRVELARSLYGKLRKRAPDSAQVWFHLGRLELGAGAPDAALDAVRKARALNPRQPEIWMLEMDTLLALSRPDAARDLLAKAGQRGLPAQLITKLTAKLRTANKGGMARISHAAGPAFKALLATYRSGDHARAVDSADALLAKAGPLAPVHAVRAAALSALGRLEEAERAYRAAIDTDDAYAEAYLQLGQLYFRTNQFEKARPALEKAHALAPNAPLAARFLGMTLAHQMDYERAEPVLKKAASLIPGDDEVSIFLARVLVARGHQDAARPLVAAIDDSRISAADTLFILGMVWDDLGQSDDARRALLRTIDMAPDAAKPKHVLCQNYIDAGDFDQARALIEADMARGRNDGFLFLEYSRIAGVAADADLCARMTRACEEDSLVEDTQTPMAFALARVMADLGRPDDSFSYLRQGNDRLRAAYPPKDGENTETTQLALRVLERGLPDLPPMPRAPGPVPIFVTGMPRSGTTLTEQILASHSQVSAGGELGLFEARLREVLKVADARDRALTIHELTEIRAEALASYARHDVRTAFITDKAIYSFGLIGLIRAILPESPILVVRRDPRDNCLSMYKNKFQEGAYRFTTDLGALGRHYLWFLDTIAHWETHCPDCFHQVRYEDLVTDPVNRTRSLIEAAGLPWEDACLRHHDHTTTIRTLSAVQARQPIHDASVAGWKAHARDLAPLIEVLKSGGALKD